jgi:hypothetical protein
MKKNIKEKDDYVCDNCGDPATYNLQGGGWVLWKIKRTKMGFGFDREKEWGLGEYSNELYCEKCAEEEGII